MLFTTSTALLAALVPFAYAQQVNITYIQGLVEALRNNNLTTLATLAIGINTTSEGQALLSSLNQGKNAVFAPTDQAFAAVPSSVSSNNTAVEAIISYHVVNGDFSAPPAQFPNVTIGRTALNQSAYVNLEGGKSQVLAWTDIGGKTRVLNQASNVTVINSTTFQNLQIFVIDSVLTIPGNLSQVVANAKLASLAGIVTMIPFTTSSGANETLLSVFEAARGYTIFAPDDAAFARAAGTLSTITNNQTALKTVIQNHVINGTSAYSTSITSGGTQYVSAAGEPFSFASNSSGTFVTSGSSTARIIRSDVLVSNGVVHVIDGVLANLQSDPAAASSAYASATSAAGQSTSTATATGPVVAITGSSKPKSGAVVGTSAYGTGGLTMAAALMLGVVFGGQLVI